MVAMRDRSRLKQRWILADFLAELAELLRGGASLNEAIGIAGRGESGVAVDRALSRVADEVVTGGELGLALADHFPRLPKFCIERLRTAQRSDELPEVAAQMADYMGQMRDLSLDADRVRKIFFYPAAVFTVAMLVVALLLLFVIPQFESLFSSFGGELPALTQWVVDLSRFVGNFWWVLLLGIAGLVLLGKWGAAHSRSLRRWPGAVMLRMPGFGRIYRLYAHAEITQTMGFIATLDGSPGQMLEASAEAVSSGYVREELNDARDRVSSGASLSDALAGSALFSGKLINILRMGESRGTLDRLLPPMAARYVRRLRDSQGLVQMLEPLMIVVLALVIGTLVLAMYLPIFQIAAVV